MKDGLSQIFPGGFDRSIETEMQRLYKVDKGMELDIAEMSAIDMFITAANEGSYTWDESMLIREV